MTDHLAAGVAERTVRSFDVRYSSHADHKLARLRGRQRSASRRQRFDDARLLLEAEL